MTLRKISSSSLMLFNDSRLVVNQYVGTFEVKDNKMKRYLKKLKKECSLIKDVK